MIFLAEMSKGDGVWPMGGSLALSKNIERRYLELGGEEFSARELSRFWSRTIKRLAFNWKMTRNTSLT
jgi:hypothetical protein